MTMNIAIIGGGWYGCHLATDLKAQGVQVKVFEQRDRLLHEASGRNQNRLHVGFHYARHAGTRLQSRDGFGRFMQAYPHVTKPVDSNIYAVTTDDSLLDFPTYRTIMEAGSLPFTEDKTPHDIEMNNIDGNVLYTPERVISPSLAREHFCGLLDGVVKLSHRVSSIEPTADGVWVDDEFYDYVIDATWGHAPIPQRLTNLEVFYEPTLLLYYRGPVDFPALTLVDGPLCSLYPTEEPGVYTLSSVPHTPLGKFSTSNEAQACRNAVNDTIIGQKRMVIEEQVLRYLPAFREHFEFIGPQLSIKTKYKVGAFDDRSCAVMHDGRLISIMSGKIDCIFYAADRVNEIISKDLYAPKLEIRRDSGIEEDIDGQKETQHDSFVEEHLDEYKETRRDSGFEEPLEAYKEARLDEPLELAIAAC